LILPEFAPSPLCYRPGLDFSVLASGSGILV
jgi:hypothetical protein